MKHFFRYHKAVNLRFTACPFQPHLPTTRVEEADYFKRNQTEATIFKASFEEHIKNYSGYLFLYTYTSSDTQHIFPNVADRARRMQTTFSESRVVAIDTQQEFFNNFKFEKHYSSPFYAYLVTGYLDNLIHRELFRHVLINEQNRLKYVRSAKGGIGIFLIAIIAGGIGSASSWIGEIVINLFNNGKNSEAWTFIGLAVIVLFIGGVSLPWILERILTNILTRLSVRASKDQSEI